MLSRPSPAADLIQMPIRVVALAFYSLFCTVLSQPVYSFFPSQQKRQGTIAGLVSFGWYDGNQRYIEITHNTLIFSVLQRIF
jgi:hypothetical protein